MSLCSTCTALELDAVFDPIQFEHLPSFHLAGALPWTKYVRKILTFTLESLDENGQSCEFCSFLRTVANIASNYRILSLLLGPSARPSPSDPRLQDGNGFTLAATSSEFIYATAFENGVPSPQPPEPCRTKPAVWLIVLKGSNTLERVAYELELNGISKIPRPLLTQVSLYVRNIGAWIAEADTDDNVDISAPIRARLVHPSKIDYPLLRSWLDICLKSHPSCSPFSKSSVAVLQMRLIDCETRTLVAAEPHMRYLALSYVWGRAPPEAYTYPSLPTTLPPTVEDSLTLTLHLGLRYIWVDRYCIWQDDPAHKATQILHMTQIYGNAIATLAAASGTDPTHGLPGVSSTRNRTPYHQIISRVGHRILAAGAIHRRQQEIISNSVWETRAWTFQEATLSSRIIFVSDIEVSFLCSECEAFEHLSRPIALVNADGTTRKSTYLNNATVADGIKGLVWVYSGRKMTFASDAFNAFAGVLRAWERNLGCFHYWGVPIIFPQSPERECSDAELCEVLWVALCWRLDVLRVRAGKRRAGFLTWSWLGVEGRVTVNTNYNQKREGSDQTYGFDVETDRGDIVGWCEFVRTGGLKLSPFSWGSKLQIQGWIFKIGPFSQLTVGKRLYYYVRVETEGDSSANNSNTVLQFLPDFGTASPERFLTRQFEAVSAYTYKYVDENYAIVFETVGLIEERIGLLQLGVGMLENRGIPLAIPTRTCDPERSFGAERGVVCLS